MIPELIIFVNRGITVLGSDTGVSEVPAAYSESSIKSRDRKSLKNCPPKLLYPPRKLHGVTQ